MKLNINRDYLITLFLNLALFFTALTGILFASKEINIFSGRFYLSILLLKFIFLSLGFCFTLSKKLSKKWLIVLGSFFLIIGFTSVFFPENNPFITKTLQKFVPIAIISIMIFSLKDYSKFFRQFLIMSEIVSLILLSYIILLIKNNLLAFFAIADTYMLFSYTVLPFTCCLLYFFIYERSFLVTVCFSLTAIIQTLFGCRGALLCLFVYFFIILNQFYIINRKYYRLLNYVLILLLSSITVFVWIKDVNLFFRNELNINSRLLRKLASGGDFNSISSGRTTLYSLVVEEIENRPLAIRGINGDSALIGGGYSHNIFLELLCDFGLIIGGFFVLTLLYLIYKTIFIKYKSSLNDLILFFFIIGFIKLLVSYSLFYETYFWCWLALLFKKIKIENLQFKQKIIG